MRNNIVFKFLAIALAALALLSSVASAGGIVALTAAGLYDRTVDQVRQDQINSTGEAMAHTLALQYASTILGGCPESLVNQRYPYSGFSHNFKSDGYGYTLKDADGNVLDSSGLLTADSGGDVSTYTFPVTGQYLYLLSTSMEQTPEAGESELLEEPLIYSDDEIYIYNAIPDTGATVYYATFLDAFDNTLATLEAPEGIGMVLCNAQGNVVLRSFESQEVPLEYVYQIILQDGNGEILYNGYSTTALGELTVSASGKWIYTGLVHPERPAELEAVPSETAETVPLTDPTVPSTQETAAPVETQETHAEETTGEEAQETTSETQAETVPEETASAASAVPEEGENPEASGEEQAAEADETVVEETAETQAPTESATQPVTEPSTEPVPETTAATVPTEATVPPAAASQEPDLNQVINGKPLREYDITRLSYFDYDTEQQMVAKCIYLPMEEMTLELYVAPNGLADDGLYQLLGLIRPFRSDLFLILGTSLLVFAILAVYLCCAAGRKPKCAEVKAGGLNRLPLDLYLLIAVLSISGLAVIGVETGNGLLRWQSDLLVFSAGAAGMGYLACLIFVGFCFAFVAQIKTPGGYWWRNSLCGRIARLGLGLLSWLKNCLFVTLIPGGIGLVKKAWNKVTQLIHGWMTMLPLSWQWLAAEAGFFLLLVIGLSVRSFLFTLLILALGVVIILFSSGYFGKLRESVRRMSQGDLDAKVDTSSMVGCFRDFGEDLNQLSGVAMEAARQQLKSERMKTELITNVSHDIKTPLTSIINYVDLLQKPHTPEEGATYLEVLDRQSQRLKKLIEDLMDMSKASTGNMTVEISVVDAVESVNQALGEFADKLEKAQLTPLLRCSQSSMMMKADGKLVWRVLSNLLTNAVKYAMPGTRLYVDLMQADGKVMVSLKNISREELNIDADELMERFVRGDGSRNTEGSGLGLNIAKSLMELQQGQLQLLVDGDLFKVTLIFPEA